VNEAPLKALLDNCQSIAMENDIFCDEIFHQKQLTSSKAQGETTKPERKVAIDNGEQFVRDAYVAIVETGPESKYDYPPMLEALTELGIRKLSGPQEAGFSGIERVLRRTAVQYRSNRS
jgi:hypothetical protein